MIVRCANCSTEFSLDDRQVGPDGATVRCSVCSHVFRVEPPEGSASDQPWQIRTVEDLLFTAPDLTTLRQWIDEGRLHPNDQVSRTGKHWMKLGDMPEFAAVFKDTDGLPQMFKAIDQPAAERSGADELGPPPAFGTGDSSSTGRSPASMLDAVTKAVQPGAKPSLARATSEANAWQGAGAGQSASAGALDVEPFEDARPRKRVPWLLFAGLGVLAGVAVVFGVPQIRNAVLGGSSAIDTAQIPELVAAHEAFRVLDPGAIGRAEAVLQREIDDGQRPPAEIAAMKLAQVELLTIRGLELAIAASLNSEEGSPNARKAKDYGERASRVFDGLATEAITDRERLKLARAWLRLAEGRSEEEILALLPEAGAEEIRLAVRASPLWRDAKAPVPSSLISELRALEEPSTFSQLVLGLAYLRSGDKSGARAVADKVLAAVSDQPTAVALRAALDGAGKPEAKADTDGMGETGGAETKQPPDEKQPPDAKQPTETKQRPETKSTPSEPRLSVDQMIDRGCAKVEGRDVKGGIRLLKRAQDRRPNDLDVLICLGLGYRKAGDSRLSLTYYERALSRSGRHRSALRGAAKMAQKSGQTSKALSYYKRLLEVEPGNGAAKAFVEKHGGGGGGEG